MAHNPFACSAPESAYVHVPFCASRCSYCDFYSKRPAPDDFRLYTETILLEIRNTAAMARARFGSLKPLRTLYFGGGTPSFLSLSALERIYRCIEDEFGLCEDSERTVEANPDRSLPGKLPGLRSMGFNRLSMGLQTANDTILECLGRVHRLDDFERAMKSALSAGFHNISTDLIFALPTQTMEDFLRDCHYLLAQEITHLSFYSLQVEEESALAREIAQDPSLLPSEEEEREMYHRLLELLPGAGFSHYEISNAGRPGYFSRHNLIYWNAKPYYAFGPAAASYVGGVRAHRPSDLQLWARQLEGGGKASVTDEIIDPEEARYEYVMLRLRLSEGLRFREYRELFGRDAQEDFAEIFHSLEKRGLLRREEDFIRLSHLGLDLANQVFLAFIRSS